MNKSDYKDMWVYIEHYGGRVLPVSLELCCEVRKLCDAAGEKLCAVVVGELPRAELEKVLACGADKLIRVRGTFVGEPGSPICARSSPGMVSELNFSIAAVREAFQLLRLGMRGR